MYTDDEQPLCCNPEQLSILKKDLLAAQALLGSCSSCFFNFRQLWCQFTCNPDQARFVVPSDILQMVKTNFTDKLASYKHHLENQDKKNSDYSSYDGEPNDTNYGKFKASPVIIC